MPNSASSARSWKRPLTSAVAWAAVVVALDQLTKHLVRTTMQVGQSIPLIKGLLHFTYVENTGGAFGILPGAATFFLVVSFVVMAFALGYTLLVRPEDVWTVLALGLLIGGSVGNLIDRASTGLVTDFIDARVWPVFNLADTSLTLGAVLFAWMALRGGGENVPGEASEEDGAGG